MRLTLLTAIISSIFIVGFAQNGKDQKYCNLCRDHVACPSTINVGSCGAGAAELVTMTPDDIKEGLKVLNLVRSGLAVGSIAGLQKASNMNELVWDQELATIAQLIAAKCDNAVDDQCRNTKRFPSTGQNTYFDLNNGVYGPIQKVFSAAATQWKRFRMGAVNVSKLPKDIEQIASRNLIQAIYSPATHVGCGAARYLTAEGETTEHYTVLVCLYSHKPLYNSPVYTVGQPPKSCPLGVQTYPGLCLPKAK